MNRVESQSSGPRPGLLVLALVAISCGPRPAAEPASEPPAPPGATAVEAVARPLAPPWSAPPDAPGDPGASPACAPCHPEHADSWAQTGMARALTPVFLKEFEGLGTVADPSGYAYSFETGPGGARIVETCSSVPGHRLEAELVYAIGAGELDRAFVALRGAFECFAPLEIVSTDSGRRAALAPGHMASPDQRFSVPITPECLGCHTDHLPPPAFPLDLHQGERWEPRGISCAACHGAVEEHTRLRTVELETGVAPAGVAPEGERDPVLRPNQLSRTQRMSICAACHLQGDVRIALDGNLGIPPPGGDLLERRAVFVAREFTQDIGFVSHTERLVRSACYLQAPSLACDTCHDPHRAPFEPAERQRVRNACQSCHPGDLGLPHPTAGACSRPPELPAEGRDCASCHMRKTPTFDVAEVEIHDHFIRRHPGAPSRAARPRTLESPEASWVRFRWPDQEPPEHVDDPGLWMMAFAHRGHLERAAALLATPPGPRVELFPMYQHSKGSLLERLGRQQEAAAAYERALELDPDLIPSAINLGLLYGLGGDPARGIALLSDVLARHPQAINALRNRAGLRYEAGDTAGFEVDLQAAFELNPLPELAEILADWFAAGGRAEQAQQWAARARALAPLPRRSPQ